LGILIKRIPFLFESVYKPELVFRDTKAYNRKSICNGKHLHLGAGKG
jgi:hypothetical protein